MSQTSQPMDKPDQKTKQIYAKKSAKRHFLSAAATVFGYLAGGPIGGLVVSAVGAKRVYNFAKNVYRSSKKEYEEHSGSRFLYGIKELGKGVLTLVDPVLSAAVDTGVGVTEYGRQKPLYNSGMLLELENEMVKRKKKEESAKKAQAEKKTN